MLLISDVDAAVGISEIDVGYDDDPEMGRWFGIERGIDWSAVSELLAIVVAVAAARLAGSPVIDEFVTLTGEREADPEQIIDRLRYDGPSTTHLGDIALQLLIRVGMR